MAATTTIRMGARGSLLSRLQSGAVAQALRRVHPGLEVETVLVKTTGDAVTDKPLHEFGGKGLFTKEIEQALLRREIDFAVHSFKDVPATMPLVDTSGLVFAACPAREDVRDALVSRHARSLEELPPGAVIGTGSLRRRCQILARRPDLIIQPVRGNIDTRIRKGTSGDLAGVILALAGLRRSGLFDPACMTPIEVEDLLPAAGQGALCLQCRLDDQRTLDLLRPLDDPATSRCVETERELIALLEGDCHSPLAALATIEGEELTLRACTGRRGGEPPVLRAAATVPVAEYLEAARAVHRQLIELGYERGRL
jgi:hydroxymethylbilane synthase